MGIIFSLWFFIISTLIPVRSEVATLMSIQNQLGEYHSIADHPKAKGVNLKFKVPKGWEIQEGDRPNIVVKFISEGDSYLVQVNEAPTFVSKNQAKELLSDSEYLDGLIEEYNSIFNEVEMISNRLVTVDNYPALEIELKGSMERVGAVINFRMKIWQIVYEDRFITLQGGVFTGREYQSKLNLFTQISNTVIFPDQYN
ncbi:hypothetical protein DFQ04_3082 [Algoriphagus boseongensis]|uniref:Uncharacterized protein n=1 Tax=Algoriphagus boseongensis TaxID=1442587 RepID=A0A4R6T612_9BACT|nr:hypothetical protein [Algoriphagus boseongensis]TDQ15196.1 hypothetical protein DFQ04_3082 [Algoriphagus boseongensis]